MDLWARQPNKAEFVKRGHVHCASKREKKVKIRQNKKNKEFKLSFNGLMGFIFTGILIVIYGNLSYDFEVYRPILLFIIGIINAYLWMK